MGDMGKAGQGEKKLGKFFAQKMCKNEGKLIENKRKITKKYRKCTLFDTFDDF